MYRMVDKQGKTSFATNKYGKYFTKGNGSQLGIQIGDYAVIDDTYFNMAVNLLEKFVENFPN